MLLKKMSQRQLQVSGLVREELASSLFREGLGSLCNISPMLNISTVWVSPDLKQARVYYTILGKYNRDDIKETTKALNDHAWQFQKVLSKLKMKFTPKLKFYFDDTFERADDIHNWALKNKPASEVNN